MTEIEKRADQAACDLAREVKEKCIANGEPRGLSFRKGQKFVIVGGWSATGGFVWFAFENTTEALADFMGQLKFLHEAVQ